MGGDMGFSWGGDTEPNGIRDPRREVVKNGTGAADKEAWGDTEQQQHQQHHRHHNHQQLSGKQDGEPLVLQRQEEQQQQQQHPRPEAVKPTDSHSKSVIFTLPVQNEARRLLNRASSNKVGTPVNRQGIL
jgi:hypothetical protein